MGWLPKCPLMGPATLTYLLMPACLPACLPAWRPPALVVQHKKWTADEVAALLEGVRKYGLPPYIVETQVEATPSSAAHRLSLSLRHAFEWL